MSLTVELLADGAAALFQDGDPAGNVVQVGAAGQFKFTEGAAGAAGGELTTFRSPSNHANGMFFDPSTHALVVCEHETRCITTNDVVTGARAVIQGSTEFNGKPLTSPNDCVISRKDGALWFTDPDYGSLHSHIGHGNPNEQVRNHVFRLDRATGAKYAVATDFERPNGLCFSPDESLLYIADSGATHERNPGTGAWERTMKGPGRHLRVFEVVDGKALANGRMFCTVAEEDGVPDGVRCDTQGNVWVGIASGVDVYAPDGTKLARIKAPETVANLGFGGPEGNDLMVCSSTHCFIMKTGSVGATHKDQAAGVAEGAASL